VWTRSRGQVIMTGIFIQFVRSGPRKGS